MLCIICVCVHVKDVGMFMQKNVKAVWMFVALHVIQHVSQQCHMRKTQHVTALFKSLSFFLYKAGASQNTDTEAL